MDTAEGFIVRVGAVAVIVFFIFASFNFMYYQYLKYRSKNPPYPGFGNKKAVFIMFVSSLAGALFFLMVTLTAYWYVHAGKAGRPSSASQSVPVVSPVK